MTTKRIATRVIVGVLVGVIMLAIRTAAAEAATVELDYVQVTSNITKAQTADTFMGPIEVDTDGTQPVRFEVYFPAWLVSSTTWQVNVELQLDADCDDSGYSTVADMFVGRGQNTTDSGNFYATTILTPASGPECYRVTAVIAGTATVTFKAGTDYVPGFFRASYSAFDLGGSTDLSGYYTAAQVDALIDGIDIDGCGTLGNPCIIEAGGTTAERLDLGWWGTWAIVGLLFVLIIAPKFLSLLNVTRGM